MTNPIQVRRNIRRLALDQEVTGILPGGPEAARVQTRPSTNKQNTIPVLRRVRPVDGERDVPMTKALGLVQALPEHRQSIRCAHCTTRPSFVRHIICQFDFTSV
jgi:hypothetical protein